MSSKNRRDSSGNGGKRAYGRLDRSGSRTESASENSAAKPGTAFRFFWAVAAVMVLAVLGWSYQPTIERLIATWNREPDYSHGFLVVPLSLWFLWARRDSFPGLAGPNWLGVLVLAASIAVRCFGTAYYVDAVEDWSLIVWCAGTVWLLGGMRVLWWSIPSLLLLFFMVPLPFRAERLLSVPLQEVATNASVWILQLLGQPALAEGNVVWIGEHHLEVAEACSGLRVFMGVVALAFAYVVLARRSWWENVILMLSVLPVALLANALRIVATSLLYRLASSQAAERFNHDLAGWAMIPLAVLLFGLVGLYLKMVFPVIPIMGVEEIVRDQGA